MNPQILTPSSVPAGDTWLKSYYFTRAAASVLWAAAAVLVGKDVPAVGAALFVLYPAWDAAANFADAQRNGGLKRSPTQTLNAGVSLLAALAVAIALPRGMNAVLGVIGVWAAVAGLLQLATGVRRWKTHGAQWAMIFSGLQSVVAGVIFVKRASTPAIPSVVGIAPYVLFGAFYFLVSAIWLTVADARRHKVMAAAV